MHNSVFEGDVVGHDQGCRRAHGSARKLEHTIATYKEMRRRGMKVVVAGGDYGFTVTPMGRQNARDIGRFVKFFGYTPAEALKCATAVGGELMGHKGGARRHPGGRARRPAAGRSGDPLADQSLLVGRTISR